MKGAMCTSVLYNRTLERKRYLEDRGYTVNCIWECEYRHMRKTDENMKAFRSSYNQQPDGGSGMSVEQIIDSVRSGVMFGVVR